MRRATKALVSAFLLLAVGLPAGAAAPAGAAPDVTAANTASPAPINGFAEGELASGDVVPVLVHLSGRVGATPEIEARAAGRPFDPAAGRAAEAIAISKQDAFVGSVAALGVPVTVLGRTSYLVSTMRLAVPANRVGEIAGLPGVLDITKDADRNFLALANSVPYTTADKVRKPVAEGGFGADGTGTIIAVIDTGIDWNHPMFGGARIPGSAPLPAGQLEGCFGPVPLPSCANRNKKVIYQQTFLPSVNGLTAMDDNGHGTHVASTAAGNPVNLDGQTVVGVAPGAKLMAFKALSAVGYSNGFIILTAMEEASRQTADHPRPDVVNMSLGGDPDTSPNNVFAQAADEAVDLGIVMAAATGNSGGAGGEAGRRTVSFPANSRKALSVGNSSDPSLGADVRVVGEARVDRAILVTNFLGVDAFTGPVESLFVNCGNAAVGPIDCGPAAAGKIGVVYMGSPHVAFETAKQSAMASGASRVVFVSSPAGPATQPDKFYDQPRNAAVADAQPQAFVVSVNYGTYLLGFAPTKGSVSTKPIRFAPPADSAFVDVLDTSSSQGPLSDWTIKPEVTAPGQNILAAASLVCDVQICLDRRDGYASITGTSMATPHVAGMAAQLIQARPDFSPQDIKSVLTGTAKRLPGGLSVHQQGGGAAKVFDAARTPVLAEPPILSFGAVPTAATAGRVVVRPVRFRDTRPVGSPPITYELSVTPGLNAAEGFTLELRNPSAPLEPLGSVTLTGGAGADVLVRASVAPGVPASRLISEGFEANLEARPVGTGLPDLHVPIFYRHVLTGVAPTTEVPVLTSATASGGDVSLTFDGVRDGALSYKIEESTTEALAFPVDTVEGNANPAADEAWASNSGWTTSTKRNRTPGGQSSYFSGQQPLLTTRFTSEPLEGVTSMTFWEFVDTEPGFDFGRVIAVVDGADQVLYETSGNSGGFRKVTVAVPAGTSTLRFQYQTDDNNDAPLFEGWYVDDISITKATGWSEVGSVGPTQRSATITDRTPGRKAYRVSAVREAFSGTVTGRPSAGRAVVATEIVSGVVEEGRPATISVLPTEGSGSPFTYRWSTGETTPTLGRLYPQDGPQSASVVVTASDGAVGSDALDFEVANVTPALTVVDVDAPHVAGDTGRLRMTVVDPGADDVTITVTSGTDTPAPTLTTIPLGRSRGAELSLQFPTAGTYRITSTASDGTATSPPQVLDIVVAAGPPPANGTPTPPPPGPNPPPPVVTQPPVVSPPPPPAGEPAPTPVPSPAPQQGGDTPTRARVPSGYWLVGDDGGIFAFGVPFFGSTGSQRLNRPVVHAASTPSGRGYWLVASDGGIFAFGDAPFLGSTGGIPLSAPIVTMLPTPSGRGYWLVASDGGVFAFGDAAFRGSAGATPLNKPIVGAMSSPSGAGYLLVASDGGVFAFGDAVFRGGTGGLSLQSPVVGAASTPSGAGYWLVAADGGIFAFGDAPFRGSTGSVVLNQPIVGMAAAGSDGYWLVASDGGIFAFGSAPFKGSTGAIVLNRPIVAMTA